MAEQAKHGADSEVGRLRTVMLHRPGPELKRLTPRNNDKLLFDGIPWVARAQDEHDAFAAELRARDVEVLYLTDLLTETLEQEDARAHAIEEALRDLDLGDTMRGYLEGLLGDASPAELTTYLTAGIRNDEVRGGFGLVTSMLAYDDFLIDPLPNLLFTRDSSVWVHDRVAITSLAMPARKRETELTELIYTRHPRFVGTPTMHGAHLEHVEGGDVLLLAPGVIAVGVGERTTPAGVERLARQCLHGRTRAHRARGADRPGAGDHAPRHDLHARRRRQDGGLPQRGRLARRLRGHLDRRRRGRRRPAPRRGAARSRSSSRRPRRWASTPCTRSTPASTR